MRLLLPEPRELAGDDLVDLYDWPTGAGLRACIVTGIDGSAIGPDGLSRSISSAADRAVLAAARALADVYLVGAGTVRAERYGPVRARPELRARRRERGQRDAPTLALVSASARFDWTTTAFTASDEPPLLLTVAEADPEDRAAAQRAGCQVVIVGERTVDPVAAVAALGERGLTRINCEGGPSLLRQVIDADLLDEFACTTSPMVVRSPSGGLGGGRKRAGLGWGGTRDSAQAPAGSVRMTETPIGAPGDAPSAATGAPGGALTGALIRMRMAHLAEDDGFLFARYVRGPADRGPANATTTPGERS